LPFFATNKTLKWKKKNFLKSFSQKSCCLIIQKLKIFFEVWSKEGQGNHTALFYDDLSVSAAKCDT
jgi:hypothetical protein